MIRRSRSAARAFDLDGSEADAVPFLQHLVGRGGLAIDANQIVLRLAVRHALGEEGADGDALGGFDVVREPAAVIVDLC